MPTRLWDLWTIMKMARMRIDKMKKKPLTAHQRAVMLMDREANRAIAHVEMLKKLYSKTLKVKEVV